jgi:fibronectin type 3 domain-containing protein
MNSIKMNRLELLAIVRENKEKHITEFAEAVADYKILVLKTTKANVALAKTEDLEEFKKIKPVPPAPQTYETSYARAIRMLELSIEEIIEVEENIFNQLVLDEWDWKRGFVASNTMYKVGAF